MASFTPPIPECVMKARIFGCTVMEIAQVVLIHFNFKY